MIFVRHVCSLAEARGVLDLLMRFILRSFLRQARPYLSASIEISNIWETEWLLLGKCSETAV